jgi:hypothetical protein
MHQLTVSYRLAALVSMILVSSILLSMSVITPDKNQAFARCPNGTHKSASGVCEQVRSSENSGSSSGSLNTVTPSPFAKSNPAPSSMSKSALGWQCDQSLWNHIYNPQRLQVVDPCKTVSGIIESKRAEADGDYHIRLKLDPQYANLVNQANVKGQFGDLVVEPICMNRVTQLDAISACRDFRQNIDVPVVGTHVQVTGSYVLDKEHGKWAEIHPVTSIIKIP